MNLTEFQHKTAAADKPVVVDFWAPWCVPCRVTKPILEKLAAEYDDQVMFLPVNADESRPLIEEYKILGIPTVLFFRDGEVAGRVTGAQNEAGYRAMFASLAEGKDVKTPMTPFDRLLRLGAGTLLGIAGFATGSWLLLGIGGVVAFLGFYDRCPVWAAITDLFRRA
jgi:thioredoxin 1